MTAPVSIVLAPSPTGIPGAMGLRDLRDGSPEAATPMPPMPPTRRHRVDERPWKACGNGVVFFPPQRRSRWAMLGRHLGVGLLVIATIFGLASLVLLAAYAGH